MPELQQLQKTMFRIPRRRIAQGCALLGAALAFGSTLPANAATSASPTRIMPQSATIAADRNNAAKPVDMVAGDQSSPALSAFSIRIATIIPLANGSAQRDQAPACGIDERQQRVALLDYVKTSRGWIIGDLIFARV